MATSRSDFDWPWPIEMDAAESRDVSLPVGGLSNTGQELWPGAEAASPSERVGASIVRRAWRVNQIVPHASLGAVHLYFAAAATNVDLPLEVHPQNVNSTVGTSPPVSMLV
jgi:hypothetical protein